MKLNIFTTVSFITVCAFAATDAKAETITTLPEGITAELYYRDATATRKWGTGTTKQEWETGIATEIAVSTDGGKIYIKNAVGNYTEGYLVGTCDGDLVTMTFPQTITCDGSTFTVARLIRNSEPDSKALYIPDPENQTINLTFDGEKLSLSSEDAMVGLLNSDMNWSGKVLSGIVYTKVDTTEVIPPAGLEEFNIALSYGNDRSERGDYPIYRLLSGCQDDEYIYIRGIDQTLKDKWMKISIDGTEASVQNGQYLGISGEQVMFFCTALDTPEWNQAYQVWEHNYDLVDGFEMNYDPAKKKLTPKNPDNALCVNAGSDKYNYGMVYPDAILTEQPLKISLTPATPFMEEDVHYFMNGAEPELMFQLLPLNEKGQLLDTAHFGYKVYMKGEPYVFNGYEYWLDDDEDMTFIPWLFQSPYIYSSDTGTQFISFQQPFVQDITIRAVYIDTDGTEYESAPLNPLNPVTAISQVESDRMVEAEEYYDLNGCLTAPYTRGILIKSTRYSDGSIEYNKIIRF